MASPGSMRGATRPESLRGRAEQVPLEMNEPTRKKMMQKKSSEEGLGTHRPLPV
jgi:hypothetical protein